MQVDFQYLDMLTEVQKIDLTILQLKKARAELPQRIEVVKVRKKRDEIEPKLEQVSALQAAKEAEITRVEDEDRSLEERQARAQADIDNAGSDYRIVESHSKDMAGIMKRRTTLAETLDTLNAELDKIKGVRAQVEHALALCDAQEAKLRAAFKEEDDALIERIHQLSAERAALVDKLPADLMSLYDKTAAKTGGVALGTLLEDGTCSVCRSALEGGRLIELRSQAPLGSCPACKRLLIVE